MKSVGEGPGWFLEQKFSRIGVSELRYVSMRLVTVERTNKGNHRRKTVQKLSDPRDCNSDGVKVMGCGTKDNKILKIR